MMTTKMQRSSWESLTPTSFKNTLYIPSLKISVTAGSFIRYSAGEAAPDAVGRIVEVVSSLDLVPDNHALIHLTSRAGQFKNESPLQYAKVNVFKDRRLFPDSHFPADNESFDRWERIVQLDKIQWIPSNYIVGLAFVAMEDDGFFDDCQGMCNFYVAKYRITEKGELLRAFLQFLILLICLGVCLVCTCSPELRRLARLQYLPDLS
jgi:hypothetical protein